ncbi:MAG: hypothetical protein Q7K29_04240 [Thermoleophilia bacterium]|nr:hypothetical protein [Thermoleophilia bacterium]
MAKNETLRGPVSNLKYIEKTGRTMRYTEKAEDATIVNFEVDGRAIAAMSIDFPTITEGDDVEVTGVASRGGGMEAARLHNHTTGADWQFNPRSAARRSFFRGG